MNFVGGQAVQSLHHRLVGQGQSVRYRLAFDEFGSHGTGGNGTAAAESLELGVCDGVAVDLEVNLHDVAALGVAHLAHTVGVFDDAHIARVAEMVHHDIAVQSHRENSFQGRI